RVHMSYLQHPLLGDIAYGGRARIPKGASEELTTMIRSFDRQALHAVMLKFVHPITGEEVEFHAPVPNDMVVMAEALRVDARENHEDDI
ncbi:MAG: 23S rRNA pseudouridine(1911/1915/1917) synthase RluD, partial [Vibrio gallaecicus]